MRPVGVCLGVRKCVNMMVKRALKMKFMSRSHNVGLCTLSYLTNVGCLGQKVEAVGASFHLRLHLCPPLVQLLQVVFRYWTNARIWGLELENTLSNSSSSNMSS
jgi:hypothetical protein